jgi:hypothetical protein
LLIKGINVPYSEKVTPDEFSRQGWKPKVIVPQWDDIIRFKTMDIFLLGMFILGITMAKTISRRIKKFKRILE